MTTVVNIRQCPDFDPEENDVYIGRENNSWRMSESPWHNPYKFPDDGTREEVIEKYRQYILSKPDLLARLPELKGKRLGCWCKPKPCHGDVLIKLLEESGK